jgi:cytoskeletal protein CcmA (bactofilin family)
MNNRLFVGWDTSMMGNAQIAKNLYVTGQSILSGDISSNGKLSVGGDISFNGNIALIGGAIYQFWS